MTQTKYSIMRTLREGRCTVTEAVLELHKIGCSVLTVQVSNVPILDYRSQPVPTEPYVTFTVFDGNEELEFSAQQPVLLNPDV